MEIVESCIEEIERINPKINAYVTLDKQGAIKAAKTADKEIKSGKHRKPLHGIPIGIKDIIDTQGVRTTSGSAIYKEYIPKRNATVINLLKKAGAVIIGKTNTHEFAFGVTTSNPHYGPTLNPWNTSLVPGGSSGGSAAAVAANLCYAALGSDTGGSIRIPAAFCGTVGLKPTYGRVSLHGVFPLATTFDHVGPLTRTVKDAAIMLENLRGFDEKDPTTQKTPLIQYSSSLQESDICETKIGITPETLALPLDPEIRTSYQEAVRTFEKLGAEIIEVKIASNDEIRGVALPILSAEAAYEHSYLLEKHQEKYGSDVLARIQNGLAITIKQYIKARRKRKRIIREMDLLFEEIDLFLTPSVQIKAPTIGEETVSIGNKEINIVNGCTNFTRLANITGFPAIVLPSGYSNDGLPLSIQLMATYNGEKELLEVAHTYEEATPELRNRKPEI